MAFAPLVCLQRLACDHEVDLGAFAFSRAEPRGGSGRSQKLAAVNSLYDSFRHFSTALGSFDTLRHFSTGAVTLSLEAAELILSPMVIKVPRSQ